VKCLEQAISLDTALYKKSTTLETFMKYFDSGWFLASRKHSVRSTQAKLSTKNPIENGPV
jgi:hypothetical protein